MVENTSHIHISYSLSARHQCHEVGHRGDDTICGVRLTEFQMRLGRALTQLSVLYSYPHPQLMEANIRGTNSISVGHSRWEKWNGKNPIMGTIHDFG